MKAALIVLGLVTAQRLGELVLAQRNTRRLLARGAREAGRSHYPLLVLLHAAWLGGLWIFAFSAPLRLAWLAVFLVLQGLRLWVIATLGERWTTRILVLDHAPLVKTGPYRLLPHPNYAVVAAEIAVLPLAFGLAWFAVLFSVLNAGVLWLRIRAENLALR